jgi:hypothetical protein
MIIRSHLCMHRRWQLNRTQSQSVWRRRRRTFVLLLRIETLTNTDDTYRRDHRSTTFVRDILSIDHHKRPVRDRSSIAMSTCLLLKHIFSRNKAIGNVQLIDVSYGRKNTIWPLFGSNQGDWSRLFKDIMSECKYVQHWCFIQYSTRGRPSNATAAVKDTCSIDLIVVSVSNKSITNRFVARNSRFCFVYQTRTVNRTSKDRVNIFREDHLDTSPRLRLVFCSSYWTAVVVRIRRWFNESIVDRCHSTWELNWSILLHDYQ